MVEQARRSRPRKGDPRPRGAFPCRPSSRRRGDQNRFRGRLGLLLRAQDQPGRHRELAPILDLSRGRLGLLLRAQEQRARDRERMLDVSQGRLGLLLQAQD